MTVEQTDSVDFVAMNHGVGDVLLVISDHLDWSDEHAHARLLQGKIYRYLDFVDSGELLEQFPDARCRASSSRFTPCTWRATTPRGSWPPSPPRSSRKGANCSSSTKVPSRTRPRHLVWVATECPIRLRSSADWPDTRALSPLPKGALSRVLLRSPQDATTPRPGPTWFVLR